MNPEVLEAVAGRAGAEAGEDETDFLQMLEAVGGTEISF